MMIKYVITLQYKYTGGLILALKKSPLCLFLVSQNLGTPKKDLKKSGWLIILPNVKYINIIRGIKWYINKSTMAMGIFI